MSPTAVKANGEEWAKNNPVGTGPFKLSEWKGDVGAEFVKNEDYWKEGLPYLDGIDWNLIQDINTATTSLRSGEVDLLSLITPLQLKMLDADGSFERETNKNGIGVTSVGVIPSSANTDSPFNDVKVRQALCHAIDRESLVNALGFGYSQTTNQWAAPAAKTYNPDVEGYPYNPEKAKELLAEAGYPDGFDTVIYAYAGDDYHPAVAQMLEKVGIRAKLDLVDFAKLNTMMLEGWEGLTYHWASVGPDLGLYMGRHLDPNGAFFAKGILHPKDTLDLLEKIRTAKNEETKLKYSFELQKLIYDKYALFGKSPICCIKQYNEISVCQR